MPSATANGSGRATIHAMACTCRRCAPRAPGETAPAELVALFAGAASAALIGVVMALAALVPGGWL